jgi:hypothetical protein
MKHYFITPTIKPFPIGVLCYAAANTYAKLKKKFEILLLSTAATTVILIFTLSRTSKRMTGGNKRNHVKEIINAESL